MEQMIPSRDLPDYEKWLTKAINDTFVADKTASSYMIAFFEARGTAAFSMNEDILVWEKLPGIFMNEKTPPKMDDFYDAPSVDQFSYAQLSKHMTVYGLIMKKPSEYDIDNNIVTDFRPRFGIGSATASMGSVPRMSNYKHNTKLPMHVEGSMKEGYEIDFIFPLMMLPLEVMDIHFQRGTFLIKEAVFT